MRFRLRRPCPGCPFDTSQPGYLRPGRAAEIAQGLMTDDWYSLACHHTTVLVEDLETGSCDRESTPDSEHCAGAMLFLLHQDNPNVPMRFAGALGELDYSEMDMSAPVAKDVQAFIEHHAAVWRRPGRRQRREVPDVE